MSKRDFSNECERCPNPVEKPGYRFCAACAEAALAEQVRHEEINDLQDRISICETVDDIKSVLRDVVNLFES